MGDNAVIVHPRFVHTLPEKTPLKSPARLDCLPLHIVHLIASKLENARDLCVFEQVCKYSREAVLSDDALWQELCHSKFKMSRHAQLEREGMSWRTLYKFHHQLFYNFVVYKRPDKLLNFGHGVVIFNIPVMA